MLSTEFTFWLQGYFEISDSNNLSPQQVQIIRDHLALVFEKVTPDRKEYELLYTEFTGVTSKPLGGIDWTKIRTPKEETRYC